MFTRRLQFLTKVSVFFGAFLLIVIIYKNLGPADLPEIYPSELKVQFIENREVNQNDLFNLKSFRHRITPSRECKSFQNEKLAVMVVMSYVGHDDLRAAHRQALPEESLNALGISRYFLLADIPTSTERYISQSQIDDESSRFGDILQGEFIDAYRNLTYKHMMGLKWVAEHCDMFKFVIKVDDDIVFDMFKLRDYMEKGIHSGNFMAGFVLDNQKVVRNAKSKWFVKEEEYSKPTYPTYLSGWLYITTPSTAKDLYQNSYGTDFFWIDDILITGVIREKSRVMTIRMNDWFSPNAEFMKCCVRDLKEHFYECDYNIGPNGGENKMLKEFAEGSKLCHQGKCFQKPLENSLHKTCVAEVHEIFRDHGDPIVKGFNLG